MIFPFFYVLFSYVYDTITSSPKYNIFNKNNTIMFQPDEIPKLTFDYRLIADYIASLLPKMLVPLLFLALILLAYVLWVFTSICCLRRTYNVCCLRFNKIIVDISLLLFLACVAVGISNNIYGFGYGPEISRELYDPLASISRLCGSLNITVAELNIISNNTLFFDTSIISTGKNVVTTILSFLDKNIFVILYNVINFSYLAYALIIITSILITLTAIKKYRLGTFLCMTNCNSVFFIIILLIFSCLMLISLFVIDVGNFITNGETYQILGSIDTTAILGNTTIGSFINYYYNCSSSNPLDEFFNSLRPLFTDSPEYIDFTNIENATLNNTKCTVLSEELHNLLTNGIPKIIYVLKTIISYNILMFASVLIASIAFMAMNKFIINIKPEPKRRQLNILEYAHIRNKNKNSEILPEYGSI